MLKNKAVNIAVKAGAFAPFRVFNRGKTPILMYHRFSRGQSFGKTSEQTLTKHLEYLTRHYQVISLDEFVDFRKNSRSTLPGCAVITIDDGYLDFYEIAFPVLKKFKIPATLFAVTGFVDGKNWIWTDKARYILLKTTADDCTFYFGEKSVEIKIGDIDARLNAAAAVNSILKRMPDAEKESQLLEIAERFDVVVPDLPPGAFRAIGWDQARELSNGNIAIGSHSAAHPILTNVDAQSLNQELTASKAMIENELQKEIRFFCYPNGNVSKRERDAAENAGYSCAVTTELRLCENNDDLFLLPRVDAEAEMTRFVQATSGFDQFKGRIR